LLKKPIQTLTNKNIVYAGRLIITLIAYVYIFLRLSNNFEFLNIGKPIFYKYSHIYLCICFILMFVNWFLESYKWKILLKPIEEISIFIAIKSVLFGLTSAIFTPYRLGEFVGRPLMISEKNRVQAVMATFVGSIAQSTITIYMGAIGFLLYSVKNRDSISFLNQHINLIGVIILLSAISVISIYFNPKAILFIAKRLCYIKKWYEKIIFVSKYRKSKLFYVLVLSQSRYIIFFTQYFLLLKAFGVNITILEAYSSISLCYLFLFSIPGIPIAEPGIRGSLALLFIGIYSDNNFGIIASSIGLWIINLALPSVIGSFFILKKN
jgi:hypothetical protein